MEQVYVDKIKKYQSQQYEELLRNKYVLDARQFLHSSILYLNYAIITSKLYVDASNNSVDKCDNNALFSSVEIMGWHYDTYNLLNMLVWEWMAHISNSIDCLFQYINAAINLGIKTRSVSQHEIKKKISGFTSIDCSIDSLLQDDNVKYIRSAYNYSKHTQSLYGGTRLDDVMNGQKDIFIPTFFFRTNRYSSHSASSLMEKYEEFLKNYLAVLDAVDTVIKSNQPVQNRYHIGEFIINGVGDGKGEPNGIPLHAELSADGQRINRYWIENVVFDKSKPIYILPRHFRTIGQQLSFIPNIEVFENGKKIGVISADISQKDTSILAYYDYLFIP